MRIHCGASETLAICFIMLVDYFNWKMDACLSLRSFFFANENMLAFRYTDKDLNQSSPNKKVRRQRF